MIRAMTWQDARERRTIRLSMKEISNTASLPIEPEIITIDMHADTAQRMVDEGADINTRLADGHLDGVRMREGNADAQVFAVWVDPNDYGTGGATAIRRADEQIAAVHRLARYNPQTWTLAATAADVRESKRAGKLAALLGLEGGYAIDEKLENVAKYASLGVRYISPTWSVSLPWAGSSGDAAGQGRGLNDFGGAVIGEMNRLGIMPDVSHVSDETFRDMIETSTKPVIASHSNARSLADVPRNITDDMIRSIADTGGVVCVVYYPAFIDAGWNKLKDEVKADIDLLIEQVRAAAFDPASRRIAAERVYEREYAARLPSVPLARLVDHIDHIARLVGTDHIGLGSDFDGIQATPRDLTSVADLPNLLAELRRRGYSEDDVRKICGGNMLRVMEITEKGT